jgi:hypothetical protein
MTVRKIGLVVAPLLAASLVPAPASAKDYAIIARNIIPSGQYRPARHSRLGIAER